MHSNRGFSFKVILIAGGLDLVGLVDFCAEDPDTPWAEVWTEVSVDGEIGELKMRGRWGMIRKIIDKNMVELETIDR